ncbi:putative selenium-dependent hydroxylase accessory protein YqeC [Dehalobacter sp. DCM]|uniref:selenium cofactor biosynthesis protein YqeC n=1 Tax=Dehalobacter sp. DCM TaxID=2907827 RepID=UPI003081F681|nr:putative selenium-dependent hydroxylase accessory protein YqeC [Dehalobacter sp. DCM]
MLRSAELNNCMTYGSLWDMTEYARVVTFIGAGGKTTCLRSMTQEIVTAGQSVISSTTTKVFPEDAIPCWKSDNPPYQRHGACFWYINELAEGGKWIGPSLEMIDKAIAQDPNPRRYWIIEGDGARGLNLKCWDSHEPQIPLISDCVVLVVDAGLWEHVLQPEHVHRPNICPDLIGQIWNADNAWCYLLRSPAFSRPYEGMSWIILFNSKKAMDVSLLLNQLRCQWVNGHQGGDQMKHIPKHLRLAAGDAKKGGLQWLDLW